MKLENRNDMNKLIAFNWVEETFVHDGKKFARYTIRHLDGRELIRVEESIYPSKGISYCAAIHGWVNNTTLRLSWYKLTVPELKCLVETELSKSGYILIDQKYAVMI